MENEKKGQTEKFKPGAVVGGDMSAFIPSVDPEVSESVAEVLTGFQLLIMHFTNTKNGHALQALQTITNELFKRAAHCFETGQKYKVVD